MDSTSILRASFMAALVIGLAAPTLSADTTPANPTVAITNPGNTGQFGKFTYTYTDTSITITGYPKAEVGAVTIPATISTEIGIATIPPTITTLPVTAIGGDAFSGCSGLTSVTIPDSVTSIFGTRPFFGCDKLTAIVVDPANPSYASQDGVLFDKLKSTLVAYPGGKQGSYSIPASVTSIETLAFYGCLGLTSVTIPGGVTSVESNNFGYCTGLTRVTIGSGVAAIDSTTFIGCTSLIALVVDLGNPSYASQDGVLFNKQKNTLVRYPSGKQGSYSIPASVTSLGKVAFTNCDGLTSVTIPTSVISIGNFAFGNCTALTRVTIPTGVTAIGDDTFLSCTSLTSVTIPTGVTSIGNDAFGYCNGLTSVTIPDTVSSIGNDAFESCTRLTNVTIPTSVTSIGYFAFDSCDSLTRVTIPASVTSIASFAFSNCTGLTRAAFLGNAPTGVEGLFDGCASGFMVTYLKGKTGFTSPTWMGYPAVAVNPAAPEIDVQQPVGSKLVDGAAKKSFGTAKVGKTGTTKIFTIKNTGTATLSGLAITKTGSQKGDFIVTAPFKTSLAPGAATNFKVTFMPRAVGTRDASIQIMSNDSNEHPFDIKLTGLGVTP